MTLASHPSLTELTSMSSCFPLSPAWILTLSLMSLAVSPGAMASKHPEHKAAPSKKTPINKKSAADSKALPPLEAQVALADQAPALPAKAWLLMDHDSGQILAAANADEPLPPASLTKMMTSYIAEQALRAGKLKETELVTVSQNAWCRGTSAESCMYLPLNSQATVIDLLRGIIVQSGNDASKAIAEHMAGSEEGFAKLMNAEAARLGMSRTRFANPTGLPHPDQKSSARDLAVLASAIIRDSAEYYPIYAEREFKYNGIKQGNRNALLYTDPSVDGLKTGHTSEAGYCLVTSAKRDGMRLISVILHTHSAQARADQSRILLSWGYSKFEKVTPIQAGAEIARTPVAFGQADSVSAGLANPWSLTVPRGQKVETRIELLPELRAPVAQGAIVGKVVATSNGKTLAEAPLVAQGSVEKSGWLLLGWQHLKRLMGR